MKYIAQIEQTVQISPDDWKLFRPVLEVDENTTIGQIRDWCHRIHNVPELQKKTYRLDVTIVQCDPKPDQP